MNIPAESPTEIGVCQFNDRQHAGGRDEVLWFLVWIGIWLLALLALLPAVI